MSNRNNCLLNKYAPANYVNERDCYKLPAINQTAGSSSSFCKPPPVNQPYPSSPGAPYATEVNSAQYADICNADCGPCSSGAAYNACKPSYNNCKMTCPPRGVNSSSTLSNDLFQTPANRGWSSNQFIGFGKINTATFGTNQSPLINQNNNCLQRPMTSGSPGFRCSPNQKTIVRDRRLADEILQKAGIPPNSTSNDCVEVITDVPVTINDTVNCDPNPLCMKKPADCQECYEQSIVVRHLQPPRPPVPAPIIIRERCAPQPPPQPPIVIRQIPPRPCTPPPLIIRECPPPMPDLQEPTIIEREVPPPPPPPRQVIVERLATPPPKPRQIIFEKWLPYEEPEDRPCIVEKAVINEAPPPKNLIIQYEAIEPRIQSQCINEGIACVDPKQFVNDRPIGNAEVCYVDQLCNLPDNIKCQLGPQALAAVGIKIGKNTAMNSQQDACNNLCVVRTNPTAFYQQRTRPSSGLMHPVPSPRSCAMKNGCPQLYNSNVCRQPSGNRAMSTSAACLPQYYNTNMLTRPGNQALTNLARVHYNPWATTYQVSYTNKVRPMCRAR